MINGPQTEPKMPTACDQMIDRLLNSWRDRSVPTYPGNSVSRIAEVEERLAVRLPSCLRTFYERTDGTHGDSIPVFEQGDWYRLFSLSELYVSAAYDDLLVFCDYMMESAYYGVGVEPNGGEHEYGSIYHMGVTNARTEKWSPKKVADSFEIFLDLVAQDSNDLFP